LTFEGSTFERLFYVADVQVDWQFSHDALHVCLLRNSVVAFFPMRGNNRYRIVGGFPEGTEKNENEFELQDIEARVKEEVQVPLELSHVNWFSVYKVHTRHVDKFCAGRCFLAGDAAHIHTPAGGQGMNTGIQDTYNLAWKLAFVLKGNAGEHILDSYNQERLRNAKRLIGTTDRMFNITAGSDWLFSTIRTTVFPPLAKYILALNAVKHRFFPMISQIGISYREDALSRHGSDELKIKAGDRVPYCLVDGNSLYDQLHAPKFHLLTFSDGRSDYHAMRHEVGSEYAPIMDYNVVPLYPHLAEVFGTDEPFHVLVRPDNYIGMISCETSLGDFRTYLSEVIGFRHADNHG
jgi:hypothetical protein